MSTIKGTNNPYLRQKEDWPDWKGGFLQQIRQREIEDHVLGKQPWRISIPPPIATFQQLLELTIGPKPRMSTRHTAGPPPTDTPTTGTVTPGIDSNLDFIEVHETPATSASVKAWEAKSKDPWVIEQIRNSAQVQREHAKYNNELLAKSTQAEIEIIKWVEATVSEGLFNEYCPREERLDGWWNNLKTWAGLNDTNLWQSSREQYRRVLDSASKLNYPNDFSTWLDKWRTAMRLGVRDNVADCTDPHSWFTDLETSIAGYDPALRAWLDQYKRMHFGQEERYSSKLTYQQVATQLGEYNIQTLRIYKKPANKVSKGVGFATWEDEKTEEAAGMQANRGRSDSKGQGRGRGNYRGKGALTRDDTPSRNRMELPPPAYEYSRKRTRSPTNDRNAYSKRGRIVCDLCFGKGHTLERCYYGKRLSERPPQFTSDPTVELLIEEKLKSNAELKSRIDKANRLAQLNKTQD